VCRAANSPCCSRHAIAGDLPLFQQAADVATVHVEAVRFEVAQARRENELPGLSNCGRRYPHRSSLGQLAASR
jgi:hypothetical protein